MHHKLEKVTIRLICNPMLRESLTCLNSKMKLEFHYLCLQPNITENQIKQIMDIVTEIPFVLSTRSTMMASHLFF